MTAFVTKEMNKKLLPRLTGQEFKETLLVVPQKCCPGQDALTLRLFIKYWELMETQLTMVFQSMIVNCNILDTNLEGFIYSKRSSSSDITQYRELEVHYNS